MNICNINEPEIIFRANQFYDLYSSIEQGRIPFNQINSKKLIELYEEIQKVFDSSIDLILADRSSTTSEKRKAIQDHTSGKAELMENMNSLIDKKMREIGFYCDQINSTAHEVEDIEKSFSYYYYKFLLGSPSEKTLEKLNHYIFELFNKIKKGLIFTYVLSENQFLPSTQKVTDLYGEFFNERIRSLLVKVAIIFKKVNPEKEIQQTHKIPFFGTKLNESFLSHSLEKTLDDFNHFKVEYAQKISNILSQNKSSQDLVSELKNLHDEIEDVVKEYCKRVKNYKRHPSKTKRMKAKNLYNHFKKVNLISLLNEQIEFELSCLKDMEQRKKYLNNLTSIYFKVLKPFLEIFPQYKDQISPGSLLFI